MPLLRSCWRRGALVLATLLLTSPLHAVAAHAALPDPPDLFQHWAACAGPDDTYCIESATRDGVDMLSGDGAVVDDAMLSGNPHLAVDATTPTSGSFTAWVPPAYFEAIGTTATDAAATGFTTDRVDGDVTTSIPGAASIVDGGVYWRIPDLHYSTPTIEVRAHQEGDTRDTFAPDPPVPGAVTTGANRVTASVSAPHFNGGAAVTQMTMRCAQGNYVRSTNVVPSATQISVTGLLSAVPATCTLTAKNAAGTSVSSHVHAATPAGIAAPGAPTHLVSSIVAGRTLKLTWVAPAAPGSSPVARYTVQVCKPTGCVGKGLLKTASTTKLLASLALPGWHAGRYLVRVLAANATKTGAAIAVTITLR